MGVRSTVSQESRMKSLAGSGEVKSARETVTDPAGASPSQPSMVRRK